MTEKVGSTESLTPSEELDNKMNSINKKFSRIKSSHSSELNQNDIEFGSEVYHDNRETIFVPITSNGSIPNCYNGAYKDEDSKYLDVIRQGKGDDKAHVEIHKKDFFSQLGKKTLVLSSDLTPSTGYKGTQYMLRSYGNQVSQMEGMSYLNTIAEYLDDYFLPDPKVEALHREEQIEQIKIQEILADETEMSADDILEKLRAE